MAKKRFELLVIDPQIDFMDLSGSALPVAGADADMKRLAAMVDRIGDTLSGINVTLDSHHPIDIAHPGMWQDEHGNMPAPFTLISSADIEAGIWHPRNEHLRLAVLDGKTIRQHMLDYTKALEAAAQYLLIIWPEHCLIGSAGYAVHPELFTSLTAWERRRFGTVNYVSKGVSPFTEHYGGLMAEVPLPNDPSTGLNTDLLDLLQRADVVAVAGEALSHCVLTTVNQIAANIGPDQVGKFHILTDCTSPVPQPPNGPDFPAIGAKWLKDMEKLGMTLTTSVEFLA